MEIDVEHVEGPRAIAIMKLTGELDASCYQDAIEQSQELRSAGTKNLLLDLSDLSFMASSGLISLYNIAFTMRGDSIPDGESGWNVLHEIRDELANTTKKEAHLKLLSPQPRIEKTLKMTGFDKLIEIFSDRDEALRSFS